MKVTSSLRYSLYSGEYGYPFVRASSEPQVLLDMAAEHDGTYIMHDAMTNSFKDIYVLGATKKIARNWKPVPRTMRFGSPFKTV